MPYIAEEAEQKDNPLNLLRKINKKYIVLIGIIAIAAIFFYTSTSDVKMQKEMFNLTNSMNITESEMAKLTLEQYDKKQNKFTYIIVGIGAFIILLMIFSDTKKEPRIIDWDEGLEFIMEKLNKINYMQKTFPTDFPEGKWLITPGCDLHPMPDEPEKPFRWEYSICRLHPDGHKQYYTVKLNPYVGDVRIVGMTERGSVRYTGEERYREVVAVPSEKIEKYQRYFDEQQFKQR